MRSHPGRVFIIAVSTASSVLLASVAAQRGPAPPPLVKAGTTEKVSEHVHVIPDGSVPMVPNVGIVVGSRGTFVIDTGMGAKNAQTILAEVAKVSTTPDLYLATTHFHPEHDLGAAAFPAQTKMLRSRDQQADIDEFGLEMAKSFSKISPLHAELLQGAQFRKATSLFDKEETVDLGGGVRVRVLAMGANHTRGDTAFYIEPDGVLFSGDVLMTSLPAFRSPYSRVATWLASLDRFEKLQPKRIVPSHGPLGDLSMAGSYRSFLTAIRQKTAELKKQGRSVDETVKAVVEALKATYPDGDRVGLAARAAYNEAR